jgi:outer membrane receptor protein involved in Fe transport
VIQLPSNLHLDLGGTYGRSGSDALTHRRASGVSTVAGSASSVSRALSVDGKLNGSMRFLPAGKVSFALGFQFRREQFENVDHLNVRSFADDRNVAAEFIEVNVPLLGSLTQGDGRLLELNVADRNEHYSDFGNTNNPKIGLVARPLHDLKLRGTYGTSFRAPELSDLNPMPKEVVPVPLFDPTVGGTCNFPPASGDTCTNLLFLFGGNPSLKPETARTWSLGFDYTPSSLPGFEAHGTYYKVKYTNRITDPESFVGLFDTLRAESQLGPAIIQRGVLPATIQEIISNAGANFFNFFGVPIGSISTVADLRDHNLSTVKTDGLDFSVRYKTATSVGKLDIGVDGTKIFNFDTKFTSLTPAAGILDTPYNPISLRLRGHATLQHDNLAVAAFVNHVGGYSQTVAGVTSSVDSWTTIDLTASYRLAALGRWARDSELMIGATNVFDQDPPYVKNANFPVNYDGANASPQGRFLFVQLTARY